MRRAFSSAGSALRSRIVRWAPWAPAGLTLALAVKGCWPALPGWPCPLRALTGIPCPTCFLTRATAAALTGQLEQSVRLHAFGPLVAAVLVIWSVLAIRQGRLVPRSLPGWPLGLAAVALLLYWLLRMALSYGLGMNGFPAFPPG
jgi:hypothetical protein